MPRLVNLSFPSPPDRDVLLQFGDLFSVLWPFVPPSPEKCPVLCEVSTAHQFCGSMPVFAYGRFCGVLPFLTVALVALQFKWQSTCSGAKHFCPLVESVAAFCPFGLVWRNVRCPDARLHRGGLFGGCQGILWHRGGAERPNRVLGAISLSTSGLRRVEKFEEFS